MPKENRKNDETPFESVASLLMMNDAVAMSPKDLASVSQTSRGSFNAVMQAPSRVEALQKKPQIISEGHSFMLLPYHLRDKQALDLNELAYKALQDFPSVSAASSASASNLVQQSIFSKLEDEGLNDAEFDSSKNYLVMYKRVHRSDQSAAVGSDANDEMFSAGRASPAA